VRTITGPGGARAHGLFDGLFVVAAVVDVSCLVFVCAVHCAVYGSQAVCCTCIAFILPFWRVIAGPKAWNSLPEEIRTLDSFTMFKDKLKTHLFI
jgi:hypothetical protein